jgi:prevent-host-death family protein
VSDVSPRDLRNNTAAVLRRAEAGERLCVTVSRRPVAELVPLGHAAWVSGASAEGVLRDAPLDPGFLDDLAPLREQTVHAP